MTTIIIYSLNSSLLNDGRYSKERTVYGKEFHNLVILTKYECLKTPVRANGTANLRSSVFRIRHRPVTDHANKSEGICI